MIKIDLEIKEELSTQVKELLVAYNKLFTKELTFDEFELIIADLQVFTDDNKQIH